MGVVLVLKPASRELELPYVRLTLTSGSAGRSDVSISVAREKLSRWRRHSAEKCDNDTCRWPDVVPRDIPRDQSSHHVTSGAVTCRWRGLDQSDTSSSRRARGDNNLPAWQMRVYAAFTQFLRHIFLKCRTDVCPTSNSLTVLLIMSAPISVKKSYFLVLGLLSSRPRYVP